MKARIQRTALWLGLLALVLLLLSLLLDFDGWKSPVAVIAAVACTIGLGSVKSLKSYQYTAWIIVAIVCGMIYPSAVLQWGDLDLRNKWVILFVIQLVMF